jgi:hypothetical protein
MGLKALFQQQTFSLTGITLLDLKISFAGCCDKTLTRSVMETRIGWIPEPWSEPLYPHGKEENRSSLRPEGLSRIGSFLEAAIRHHFAQDEFSTGSCLRGRWGLHGKKLHASQKLPVGIFQPLCDALVVTEVVWVASLAISWDFPIYCPTHQAPVFTPGRDPPSIHPRAQVPVSPLGKSGIPYRLLQILSAPI